MILCDNSYEDWLQYSDIWYAQQHTLKDVHHTNKVWTTKEKYLMQQSNDEDDSWLGVWEVALKNGCIHL